jgi:hypothetical protein
MMLYSGSRLFRRKKGPALGTVEPQPGDLAATSDWLTDIPAPPADSPGATPAAGGETKSGDAAPGSQDSQGTSGSSS